VIFFWIRSHCPFRDFAQRFGTAGDKAQLLENGSQAEVLSRFFARRFADHAGKIANQEYNVIAELLKPVQFVAMRGLPAPKPRVFPLST
jgi:hypothetical protein